MALATQTVTDILNDYGVEVVAELTDNLEHSKKVATGTLSESIRYQVKILGNIYVWELYMAPYWKFVDKGRGPGKPPPRLAILKWLSARRLGAVILGAGKNKAVGKKSVIATDFIKQRAIAYLIARKIGREGTKGSGFYTNTFKSGHAGDTKGLEESLSELLQRDVKVMIEEVKAETPPELR